MYSKISNKILSQTISQTGYYNHATKIGGRDGKSVCFKIHRLVASAFVPNTKEKPFVNHIDGNKLNNRFDNLEWVTAKENSVHAHKIGLCYHPKGEENINSKLTFAIVNNIREDYKNTKTSQRALAVKYHVSKTTIQNTLSGSSWV